MARQWNDPKRRAENEFRKIKDEEEKDEAELIRELDAMNDDEEAELKELKKLQEILEDLR